MSYHEPTSRLWHFKAAHGLVSLGRKVNVFLGLSPFLWPISYKGNMDGNYPMELVHLAMSEEEDSGIPLHIHSTTQALVVSTVNLGVSG